MRRESAAYLDISHGSASNGIPSLGGTLDAYCSNVMHVSCTALMVGESMTHAIERVWNAPGGTTHWV